MSIADRTEHKIQQICEILDRNGYKAESEHFQETFTVRLPRDQYLQAGFANGTLGGDVYRNQDLQPDRSIQPIATLHTPVAINATPLHLASALMIEIEVFLGVKEEIREDLIKTFNEISSELNQLSYRWTPAHQEFLDSLSVEDLQHHAMFTITGSFDEVASEWSALATLIREVR